MSCLFNSLSKFTEFTNGNSSYDIRQKICDYLATNPILFDEIKAENVVLWESGMNLSTYIQRMRSTSTWGGATEIKCFCDLYKVNVEVVNIRNESSFTLLTRNILFEVENSKGLVRISWSGGHYEPL